MRENEFEKQVREKMEYLGFDPSESVWTGIHGELNQEKKRRKPIFWLFFASGVLLAGTALYFAANKKESTPAQKIAQRTVAENKNKSQAGSSESASTGTSDQGVSISKTMPVDQKQVGKKYTNRKSSFVISEHKRNKTASGGQFSEDMYSATDMTQTKSSGDDKAATGKNEILISNYDNKTAKSQIENGNKKILDSTGGKMITGLTATKTKKDSVSVLPVAKNKEQKTKSPGWQWGFTGGVGSSNLDQSLFNSVKTLSPVNFATSASPANNVAVNYSSSEISPGFSFTAGAFISKNITKRISVSAGINYHYFSTSIHTGMKINTTLNTTNSFNQFISAESYYENGHSHTFINQYHMIEIPVLAGIQLNKSKRIPLIWQLGLTPGYMVGSNALYYDPNTNVYFKNYLQPKKLQLNGVTALMIGLPFLKGQVQMGPQLQYGFTGFVNTNDGNPGHLFYAGLKISFIPGKK